MLMLWGWWGHSTSTARCPSILVYAAHAPTWTLCLLMGPTLSAELLPSHPKEPPRLKTRQQPKANGPSLRQSSRPASDPRQLRVNYAQKPSFSPPRPATLGKPPWRVLRPRSPKPRSNARRHHSSAPSATAAGSAQRGPRSLSGCTPRAWRSLLPPSPTLLPEPRPTRPCAAPRGTCN